MTNRHDDHYSTMKVEPWAVMVERIQSAPDVPPDAALALSLALKYIMRAGRKVGQPWRKDVEKGLNYLNMAIEGNWAEVKGQPNSTE
jgi:hypothetical protein